MSPKEAFEKGQRETGTRPHKLIAFNQDFLIATCPSADRQGKRTVDGQRGVKVNNFYYFTPELRDPEIVGKQVSVRVDPSDAATVYVQVRGKWLGARCAQLSHLPRMNLRQLEAVTAEYFVRYPQTRNTEHSTQRLQEYVSTFKPNENEEKDWQGQLESIDLQQKLGLLGVLPQTPALVQTPAIETQEVRDKGMSILSERDDDERLDEFDNLPDFEDL